MKKTDILKLIPLDRLIHSNCVAHIARELAEHHSFDIKQAEFAGLMHDLAKDQTPETLEKAGISVSDILLKIYKYYPPLFHAFAGPVFIKHMLEIENKDMLNAVKWHTTGHPKMKPLELITYIADFTDPERGLKGTDFVKELAFSSLEKAAYAVSVSTIRHLLTTGKRIHPLTIWCRNYYLEKVSENEIKQINEHIL